MRNRLLHVVAIAFAGCATQQVGIELPDDFDAQHSTGLHNSPMGDVTVSPDDLEVDTFRFEPVLEIQSSEATRAEFDVQRWAWASDGGVLRAARVVGYGAADEVMVDATVHMREAAGAIGIDVRFVLPMVAEVTMWREGETWISAPASRAEPLAAALLIDNESAYARQQENERIESTSAIQPVFLEWIIAYLATLPSSSGSSPGVVPGSIGSQVFVMDCVAFTGQCGWFAMYPGPIYDCNPITTFSCACAGFALNYRPHNLCTGGQSGMGGAVYIGLTSAQDWCTHSGATRHVADYNGDGQSDVMCRDATRLWFDYADATTGEVAGVTDWYVDTTFCTHSGAQLHLGDYNGDARTDLLCLGSTAMWIDLASTTGQFAGPDWSRTTTWCGSSTSRLTADDVNADGRTDLVCRTSGGSILIDHASTTGTFLATDVTYSTTFCTHSGARLHVGDVNGDSRADLVCHDSLGRLYVDYAAASGAPYSGTNWYRQTDSYCTHASAVLRVGDVNGDGRADLLCEDPSGMWADFADASGQFYGIDWYLSAP